MEQAGGKKHSLRCADQLLINKMVLDQVKRSILYLTARVQKLFI